MAYLTAGYECIDNKKHLIQQKITQQDSPVTCQRNPLAAISFGKVRLTACAALSSSGISLSVSLSLGFLFISKNWCSSRQTNHHVGGAGTLCPILLKARNQSSQNHRTDWLIMMMMATGLRQVSGACSNYHTSKFDWLIAVAPQLIQDKLCVKGTCNQGQRYVQSYKRSKRHYKQDGYR